MDKRYSQIILRPIVTEKSAQMTQLGQYTFEVTKDANKVEIKQAMEQLIKELYPGNKSEVLSVNTVATRGRFSRRRRHSRVPKDGKKAIVTIGGDPLELFES
ncbi:50S ribosomal protein L23 [Candidatus Obscuribacterales bacterium]|jgi:large subunit ribosomal protein L23|nr:50S ribosomal protein L23 [Candidatus Obscuribacterales bacterium]MBX3138689.1 50S ribosomal protein L23 [Candidatus Obscuribacterales bacterium]MBX3154143.1 50S ribosomal protein L23 [Candidatus Obscuribacterales bacterium]